MRQDHRHTQAEQDLPSFTSETETLVDYPAVSENGSSWLGAAFVLANATIGTGLLSFPKAYEEAGSVPSAVSMQMICVVFVVGGMLLIAHCSDLADTNNYQDVVEAHCGPFFLVICNVFIILHNFGACITLLVLLGDEIDQVLKFAYGAGFCQIWFMSRNFTLAASAIVFILPFCFYRRIDAFQYCSFMGVFSTLYIAAIVIAKFFTANQHDSIGMAPSQVRWLDIFRVIPTFCFSFEGHIEAVPLYSCLAKRNMKEFTKTAVMSLFLCALVYTPVGTFGYLTFGSAVKSNVLVSYFPPDVIVLVAMGILGIKIITTYPIVFYCVRTVVDDTVRRTRLRSRAETCRRYGETIVLFGLSLGIALWVPSIGSVINVLGGSAALFIFVFPGLCYLQAHMTAGGGKGICKLFIGLFYVVIGTFVFGATTMEFALRFSKAEFDASDVVCQKS